jgi:hypothetical protein
MPCNPPRRRITLADIMLLVASTAGLFAVIHTCLIGAWAVVELNQSVVFRPIQAVIGGVALFLSFGGYGACAARWRGRARFEGFCWGFIFGPLGVLMIGLMPDPSDD